MRLLVVEDEPDLRRSLARSLKDAQFAVDESGVRVWSERGSLAP